MTLDDAQRHDLVAHLAQRLPGFGERSAAARDAGLGDTQLTGEPAQAWAMLVEAAVQRHRLPRLLSAAARQRPGDALLMGLATSAADGALVVPRRDDPKAWVRGAAIAGAVVLLLGIVALVADLSGLASMGRPVDPGPAEVGASLTPPNNPTPPGSEEHADPAPADRAPATVPAAAPAVEPPTPPADGAGGVEGELCPGKPTEIVGYVYSGKTAPPGLTWRLSATRNVRVDYPRRENRWNSGTRVVCVLPRGATLRVERPPVLVEGGAYWVPVVGGAATPP